MNDLEIIRSRIYEIRGQKVMLDKDLAELYNVTTSNLNKAVKRNLKRFPEDFMFQLTQMEFDELRANLIFQNGTSSRGGTRIQLEAINRALADLQADRKKAAPHKRIGFNTED